VTCLKAYGTQLYFAAECFAILWLNGLPLNTPQELMRPVATQSGTNAESETETDKENKVSHLQHSLL